MKLNDNIDRFNVISSFSENPKNDFGIYEKGYHNAARILTDNFIAKTGFSDYDGYPIVFLYRHSFELSLKNIIYNGIRLSHLKNIDNFDNKLYNNHFLLNLAEQCEKILKKLFSDDIGIDDLIKKILQIAKEFEVIDKSSFSYRYPIDRNGNYSTDKHQAINITSLSYCMEDLLDSLESLNFGIDIEISRSEEIAEILFNYY